MINEYPPTIEIRVREGSRCTSLPQTGVGIKTAATCSIGDFLAGLPGFSREYILNRVQTIFLNGTAIDDLDAPLPGTAPVLALSAAMPGLAGAIFRRNSVHAALRSKAASEFFPAAQHPVLLVKLKLFNMIAEEKGEALLAAGVDFTGAGLRNFLLGNPALLNSITHILFSGEVLGCDDLIKKLKQTDVIHLIIKNVQE